MKEEVLHQLIKDNENIQQNLLDAIGIQNEDDVVFNSEDQYPNGLYADFTILKDNKVKAIIELKGSEIGANEFVRGTGQLFQYQHFINLEMSIKSYVYKDAICVLCFPSGLLEDIPYNIGLFAYPKNCVILEFNEEDFSFRKITEKDLKTFAGSHGREMVTVSPYYVRDTRLFEIFIALRFFHALKMFGNTKIDRKKADDFLKQLNTPDNGNWRNVFITLSSLGFIDDSNITTALGSRYANYEFDEFAYEIYISYISKYFWIINQAILHTGATANKITLSDMKKEINSLYRGKDVLFMTDSDNRYLSSWLNIMKDDFGCIDFEPNKSQRYYDIKYPIDNYNKKAICAEIRKKSIAYEYINRFNELMKSKVDL